MVRRHPDERQGGRRETGGAFTFIEWSAPAGFGPPLHVHGREDEAFYILDGQISVECGAKRFTAGPGDFTFLPRGIPHTFLVTRGPVRGLQITAPAGFEEFIAEAGAPRRARPARAGRTRHRAPGRRRAALRPPDPRPAAGLAVTVTRCTHRWSFASAGSRIPRRGRLACTGAASGGPARVWITAMSPRRNAAVRG